MKTIKNERVCISSLLLCLTSLILISCSSSPFGENEISSESRSVSGQVQLDNDSPEDVYVWLEEFNVGTFTDESGTFTVTLPHGFDDVSGIFDLYFYVANYHLKSIEVVVRNGEFLFSQGPLNSKGELSEIVTLTKFLFVNTDVSPDIITVTANIDVTIDVSLSLRTVSGTATVILPNTVPGLLGQVFFKNIETEELFLFNGIPVTTDETVLVGVDPVVLHLTFEFIRVNFAAGKYLVIPYILFEDQEAPEELRNSIALNVEAFGPNYLKLPFKREGGQFEVR